MHFHIFSIRERHGTVDYFDDGRDQDKKGVALCYDSFTGKGLYQLLHWAAKFSMSRAHWPDPSHPDAYWRINQVKFGPFQN